MYGWTNCSWPAGTATGSTDTASLLAQNVYEGVKQRMQQLQAAVQAKERQIAALQADMVTAEEHRATALKQADAKQQVSHA